MFRKKENNTLDIILKILLIVGIVAGVCVVAKILYDKYKKKFDCLEDDGFDCDFECLENDDPDCDCDNCKYKCTDAEKTESEEKAEEPAKEAEA